MLVTGNKRSVFHSFTRHIWKDEAMRFLKMDGMLMIKVWSIPNFIVDQRRNRESGNKL